MISLYVRAMVLKLDKPAVVKSRRADVWWAVLPDGRTYTGTFADAIKRATQGGLA